MKNGLSLSEELGTFSPIIAFQRILLNLPNYDSYLKNLLLCKPSLFGVSSLC